MHEILYGFRAVLVTTDALQRTALHCELIKYFTYVTLPRSRGALNILVTVEDGYMKFACKICADVHVMCETELQLSYAC